MYDGPIMVTGVYRSGKNLLAHILNNHPRLEITSETLHFFRYYLGRYEPVEDRYVDIVKEATNRLALRFNITVPAERIIEQLRSKPSLQMKDVYEKLMLETFCNGAENVRWGEMTGLQWSNIPLFLEMFPTGQVIQIIRDPRDVLASYRGMTNERPYRYLDAVFCCLHAMNWAATAGRSLPKDRYLILRHEDVVGSPDQTVHDLCRFLHIDYQPEMSDPTRFTDDAGNLWRPDSPFGDVGQIITPVSTGRWKSNLQPFEITFAESVLGGLLPEFGYQLSDVKASAEDLGIFWDRVRETPLLQSRLSHWMETGEGVESFPSDPTDPANWAKLPNQQTAGTA